jgi:hypothetical protein
MSPAFLVYVTAKKKADRRISKQYSSNIPTGIV